jgi:hypothetical protein
LTRKRTGKLVKHENQNEDSLRRSVCHHNGLGCAGFGMGLQDVETDARIWTKSDQEPQHLSPVIEVGRDLRIHDQNRETIKIPSNQFDRSVRAFGAEGQATLASLRVGIIGLGGIGSIVAEQLAHLGIRN